MSAKAKVAVDRKGSEICASFAIQRMDGTRTLDAELSRCRHLITQKETELTALKNGLPDKLLATTTLPQDSRLAHLLAELHQAEAELQAAPSSPLSTLRDRFAKANLVTLFSARFDKLTGGRVKPLWAKVVIAALVALCVIYLAPLFALGGAIALACYWKRLTKPARWVSIGGIALLFGISAAVLPQHQTTYLPASPVDTKQNRAVMTKSQVNESISKLKHESDVERVLGTGKRTDWEAKSKEVQLFMAEKLAIVLGLNSNDKDGLEALAHLGFKEMEYENGNNPIRVTYGGDPHDPYVMSADMKEETLTSGEAGSGGEGVRELGTLATMGGKFYDDLPFAKVDQADDATGVELTTDFCPDGTKKYRKVLYDTLKILQSHMSEADRQQLSSLGGGKVNDRVSDFSTTWNYNVSPGEPKVVFRKGDTNLLPYLKLGAVPGDTWEWKTFDAVTREPIYNTFTYRKAVKHRGHICVLIDYQMSIDVQGRRCAASANETWYAEGIGVVKQDEYNLVGKPGDRLTKFGTVYLVGE